MRDLVLATANSHKAEEIRRILEPLGFHVHPRPDTVGDVEETQATLKGNAILKARAISRATKMAALADDTGLFVESLNGAPGVRSARYAGDDASDVDNVDKLLLALTECATENRFAYFETVIAVDYCEDEPLVVSGRLDGMIALQPRGSGGFGYDCVFVPVEGPGRTLAELDADEKNNISHRGRALRALVERLTK